MKVLPHIYIAHTPDKGRGVYTALEIPAGSPIEICPLILIPADQSKLIDQTALYDYYFIWDQDHLAIALGYGSLYNHSRNPNAKVIYDFDMSEIQIEAIRDIDSGEEILINYHDDESFSGALWFEEKIKKPGPFFIQRVNKIQLLKCYRAHTKAIVLSSS